MAKMPFYDPRDSEILSPLMAGFSEGLGVLSEILNLNTKTIKGVALEKLTWINSEGHTVLGMLYQAPQGNKLWLTTPYPVIRKNGAIITESADHFTIDPIGGGLFFEEQYALLEDDEVTVDATVVTPSSQALYSILQDISDLKTKAAHDKGYYANPSALEEAVPTGADGDYAIVGTTDTIWLWDTDTQSWVDSHKATDLSNYYTKGETDNLLSQKEPNISAKGSDTASDNFYYGGRKQWIDLLYKVRNTALSGLDTSTAQTIIATDTILAAMGKLQAQITQSSTEVSGDIAAIESDITDLQTNKADKTELPHKVVTVTLDVEGWQDDSEEQFSHAFTDSNITATDKLNVAPTTDTMIGELVELGVTAIVAKNDNGTASIIFYGAKPTTELSFQVEIVPVNMIGDDA